MARQSTESTTKTGTDFQWVSVAPKLRNGIWGEGHELPIKWHRILGICAVSWRDFATSSKVNHCFKQDEGRGQT